MPPTLEEILAAIQAVTSARTALQSAEQTYGTINAQVAQDTTAEAALFAAQQATYESALTVARNALGWPAALATLQAANLARNQAERDALNLMAAYVANTPA